MPQIVKGGLPSDQITLLQEQYVFDGLDWVPQSSSGGGGGGGTEYTEDAAAAANPLGPMTMFIRSDTPTTQVSADGDNIAARGTNYGAAYVTLLDTGGNPVSVGGGTQYTEDAASAADPIGTVQIARRRDALSSEVSADGDNIALNATSKGEQYVKHVDAIPVTDNSGSLTVDGSVSITGAVDTELPAAAALADAASATPTTPTVGSVPLLMNATTLDRQRAVVNALDSTGTGIAAAGLVGQLDDTSTSAVTENQFAPVRISSRRALLVEGVASGTAIPVSGTITANAGTNLNTSTLALESGGNLATLASAIRAEDSASADADKGIGALAIRKATPANTSGTDGDYEYLQMSAGRLWASANVDQINGVTPLMGAGNTGTGSPRVTVATDQVALSTWGHGATAASVPANITYQGSRGTTALPTAVSDGQSVGLMADKFGRNVVHLGTIRDLRKLQRTTISASTAETTIVTAAGANVFADLIAIVVSNSSATGIRLDIRDATAGSIIFDLYCPPTQTIGFALPGASIPQTTANNNWTAQCSSSVTDIRITAITESNK